MSKKQIWPLIAAIVVPVLLQFALEAMHRSFPVDHFLAGIVGVLQDHDFAVMVVNVVTVGGFLLFRAFRPLVAAATMIAYVPLMIAIQFGATTAFVGLVYGDAI